jgi:hypothetical protein
MMGLDGQIELFDRIRVCAPIMPVSVVLSCALLTSFDLMVLEHNTT